jgi:hypothetical protein
MKKSAPKGPPDPADRADALEVAHYLRILADPRRGCN